MKGDFLMASITETTNYGTLVTMDYRERDNGATQILRYTHHSTGLIKLYVLRAGQQVKFFSNNPGTAVVGREANA
jgi:hypothetical protein